MSQPVTPDPDALDSPPGPYLGLFDAAEEEIVAVIRPLLAEDDPDRDRRARHIAHALLARPR